MGRVSNKTSVVTGAALGIGRAAALLLAKEGAKVAVTDVLDKQGKELVSQIKGNGGEADFWHLDVSDEKNVEQIFKDIGSKYNQFDVLVNNAGISGINKPTHQVTLEEWDKVMSVNVKGVFLCTKYAIPHMMERGGSIVNISSIYGLVGSPDMSPYHASKGAVRLMTKTDAMIYAEKNIRVNSVHPGYIWTPMVQKVAQASGEGEAKFREKVGELHPLGHLGEPEDIANGILFLASDESKFMTGSELVIDGGYTAK